MIENAGGFIKIILVIVLTLIIVSAIIYMYEGDILGLIYKLMGKTQKTQKVIESQDNMTIYLKYNKVVINAPRVFENKIIVKTIQPHRLKFIMHSKTTRIYFEGGTHEVTVSVMGTSSINIELDATVGIIPSQTVTIEVYSLDDENKPHFLKNLTFTVDLTADYFLRMYPSKDTRLIGYYDLNNGGTYEKTRINNYVKTTSDVTLFSNIMLLYAESRINYPFKVKFDVIITRNSGSKLYDSMLYYTGLVTASQPQLKINTQDEQEFVYTVNYNRIHDWIMFLPYLHSGYYDVLVRMSVYLNNDPKPVAEKTLSIRLISVPSQGYVMLNSIAFTLPYGLDSKHIDMKWYYKILLWRAYYIEENYNDKEVPIVSFVDTSVYMPMPDTQLTDRHPNGVYTYSAKMIDKYFVLKFASSDNAINGDLIIWSKKDGNTVNVYTLQYYYLSDDIINFASRQKETALGDLITTIKNLLGMSDFNNKEYFPLLYTDDVIVSLGLSPPTDYSKIDDYYAVCFLNYKGVPSVYLQAFMDGNKDFLEKETQCGKVMCHEEYTDKFIEDNNCDCATSVHHTARVRGLELNQFRPYLSEGLIHYESISGFKVYKNTYDQLMDLWNTIKKLLTGNKKETVDDDLTQESVVLLLLHPNDYKASKYIGVVHYYVVTYKVDGVTYVVHVYSFMNMPLDKVEELALEYYDQKVNKDSSNG